MTRLTRSAALAAAGLLLALPMTATAAPVTGTTPTPDPHGADDAQLLLLLDASGSMADPDAQGTPKIEAARAALRDVVTGIAPDQQVGLRVFGGDVALDQPTEDKCTDSRLVVPIGTGQADELDEAIEGYEPLGETPIGYALQQAADDLGPEGHRTVLLVSDGIATCDPDPCEVAEELSADGLDLVVHTVGLGVDDATRGQLQCIADAAGGTYYDTDDTETLTTALTRVSTRAFRPFTFSGTPVAGSADKEGAPLLEPGQYLDTMTDRGPNTAKYYRLNRTTPGSTLRVSATMRPEGDVNTGSYSVRLLPLDGGICGAATGRAWSSGSGNNFGSAATQAFADPEMGQCGDDEELLVEIAPVLQASLLAGQTVELTVSEEPPVSGLGDLPEPAPMPTFEGPELEEPVAEVLGGQSFDDAVPIEAGETYASDIRTGEVMFFRVPVGWGQRLEAVAEFPAAQGAMVERLKGGTIRPVDLMIFSPDRGMVTELSAEGVLARNGVAWQEDRQVTATAAEVRYRNREEGTSSGAADRAGDYYVAVGLASSKEGDSVVVPFTFSTQLVGEPHGEPDYVAEAPGYDDRAAATDASAATASAGATDGADDAQPSADAGAPTGAATGDEDAAEPADAGTAAPEAGEDDGSGMPLAWVLGGVGVVLAGAGGVLLAARGRGGGPV